MLKLIKIGRLEQKHKQMRDYGIVPEEAILFQKLCGLIYFACILSVLSDAS